MSIESITIRLLGKLILDYPNINQNKVRLMIEEILNDYEIKERSKALVVSDIPQKSQMFLAVKKLDGLSEGSLYNYTLHLKRFNNFIVRPVNLITTTDIRVYLAMLDQKVSPNTLNTCISILKSFFSWLTDEEYIEKNPMKKIKNTKEPKRLRKALSLEELELLKESSTTLRQRCMIEVFYSTGCRLNEVENINIDDINWDTMSLRVIGKGNKERIVYISPKCKIHLQKYLDSRTDNEPALFVTYRKPTRRIGRRSFQREFAILGKRAGIKKRVYPHLLRHTTATVMINNGADITIVQYILGHSSPATTQVYARLTDENVKQAHKKFII